MAPHFILGVTLGMAAVVARVSIAASVSRERGSYRILLANFVEVNFQEPGRLTVNQRNPHPGVLGKNWRKRLQMKSAIHEQLGWRRRRWQIELAPQLPTGAGEYRLGAGLIAVQTFREMKNLFKIGNGIAVPAIELQLLNRFADQVLCENSFLAVRFILRRAGLKIKADSKFIRTLAFK